ncbi:MAG: DNA polymerase III subunit delta' [Deltaproteobacteria bacterium]|nr:DNA polymerase III subunit delta' [Deltaproteobacteria bacterium]
MPFESILGQASAVATLTRALGNGRVHHAYRFEGPDGVGKRLAAVAFAQALVCTAGGPVGCGACEACRRAATRSERAPEVPLHPDVIVVGRGLYPPELIGNKKESSEISVEQIRRVVLARTPYRPHEARHQVFLIEDADLLGTSAANALLKTLEEPKPGTQFVLLTSQPESLLDTVRSRTMPVRFGALSDDVLKTILRARGIAEAELDGIVALAGGSASRALDLADPERSATREAFVRGMLDAVRGPGLGAAVAFAEGGDRERLAIVEGLRALGAVFVREARTHAIEASSKALWAARRHALVLDAIDAIERNGQASLVLSGLAASLKAARQLRPGRPPGGLPSRR